MTNHPRGANMHKLVATLAVTIFAFAAAAAPASAAAQDYRSPDAHPAIVSQDYRSPDAHPNVSRPAPVAIDLRSPDARPSGAFAPTAAPSISQPSKSFEWGYLVLGIALAGLVVLVVTLTQRRRRHGLAIDG
jgi:hypothetical protein